jgi:hypothetical protein
MNLVRDARTLKQKAIHSLKASMSAFNGYEEDGRVTTVLLHAQHACEMLLKAVLVQKREVVFDKGTGKSIGFERCLRLCSAKHGLSETEAGIMRAIDSLRDAAQHWFVVVAEDILYLNVRALITAFDDYLRRTLEDDLAHHIPPRVLPVSTIPPGDFEFLIDREYTLIADLLKPGRRARDEARARVRSLLAMEAVAVEGVEVSEADIDRIEKAVRSGAPVTAVFPRLSTVGTETTGEGITLKVHFSKKEGPPVHFVAGDDPAGAAAVREVDLRRKFHLSRAELARSVNLNTNKAKLLRDHLGIDADQTCHHLFEFGKQKHPSFSDNAVRAMKDWLASNDIETLWRARAR